MWLGLSSSLQSGKPATLYLMCILEADEVIRTLKFTSEWYTCYTVFYVCIVGVDQVVMTLKFTSEWYTCYTVFDVYCRSGPGGLDSQVHFRVVYLLHCIIHVL